VQQSNRVGEQHERSVAPVRALRVFLVFISTIGIGTGIDCDAQLLVWPDMSGPTSGPVPKFVEKYADLGGQLLAAAQEHASEVREAVFPGPEHSFD
jgi:3-methyl-2-oxobutanoate hydroxymethyltransferase